MMSWIVLFRGVNVGGNRKLPMAKLRALLVSAGFSDVQSYIQSGNVVLRSELTRSRVKSNIEELVEREFGFSTQALVLSAEEMEAAIAGYPFAPVADQSRAHLFFEMGPSPMPNVADLVPENGDSAQLQAEAGVIYLSAPDGMSSSRLAELLSRRLKDKATARNLRTCTKLLDMARHDTS